MRYIRISWPDIGRFFIFLYASFFTVVHFFFLIELGEELGVWELVFSDISTEAGFSQMVIIYYLILEAVYIAICIVCLSAFLKRGFLKLKGRGEAGLISILSFSLIVGIVAGLITGTLSRSIEGMITGVMVGIICGFLSGVTIGINYEFGGA